MKGGTAARTACSSTCHAGLPRSWPGTEIQEKSLEKKIHENFSKNVKKKISRKTS